MGRNLSVQETKIVDSNPLDTLPTASPHGQQSCPCHPAEARHVNGHNSAPANQAANTKSQPSKMLAPDPLRTTSDIPSFDVKKLPGAYRITRRDVDSLGEALLANSDALQRARRRWASNDLGTSELPIGCCSGKQNIGVVAVRNIDPNGACVPVEATPMDCFAFRSRRAGLDCSRLARPDHPGLNRPAPATHFQDTPVPIPPSPNRLLTLPLLCNFKGFRACGGQ